MLKQIDINKSLGKNEYKKILETEIPKLARIQRKLKERSIPVLVLFEGWSASGKGKLINELITPLDQRGVKVLTLEEETKEEKVHSFFWPFWINLPPKGKLHVFDLSWYTRALNKQHKHKEGEITPRFDEINMFEEQLVKDGMILIKFFLHISKDEQEKRFYKLRDSKDTRWRVSKSDKEENEHYKKYLDDYEKMLIATDTSYAVWNVIEAMDKRYASAKIISVVEKTLTKVLEQKNPEGEGESALSISDYGMYGSTFRPGILNSIDLSKNMTKAEYKDKVEKLQKQLFLLQNRIYHQKIPVIIALEGWDAAGKGGAIKRITEKLDPRGYEVIPISAPNDYERQFPYLWRFFMKFPSSGNMTIFDRTWYGRVLVERVEGFAKREEWSRAYGEINQMEKSLSNDQYIILKFWLHMDKEEQEKRFRARELDPEKQWKITEEDWRNRSKWADYEEAADEMLVRTSTDWAPWTIVEANSKYFARIKILETIVNTLERRLKERAGEPAAE